jgi:hypothetical protein
LIRNGVATIVHAWAAESDSEHCRKWVPSNALIRIDQTLRWAAKVSEKPTRGRLWGDFRRLHLRWGLAVADLDNDGRLDWVVLNQNEPLVYLHSRTKRGGPFHQVQPGGHEVQP